MLVMGLSSCTIGDEVDYIEKRAAAECGRMERCYLGEFQSQFSGADECERLVGNALEDDQELLEEQDCDYDPREAQRCVERVRSMSCSDWIERGTGNACDLVFRCDT